VPAEPRATLDDRVDAALREAGTQLVVLAGYLRLFRVQGWRGRCINIHPALLPRHGGKGLWGHHVHEAVLAAGDRESGCTVHWVDEQYDHGETILQRRCPVLPGDTPDTLAARVFAEELEALPEAIRRVGAGGSAAIRTAI
jgi:phosphoribosylglycinamide formyltransferase-1